MKSYNKNILFPDAKKLYGWEMFQKLSVNSFK